MNTTDNPGADPSAAATHPSPADADPGAAEVEHRFHHYTGNRIPWYVRFIWVLFWVFAIYYALQYLFPEMRIELKSPP